MALNADSRDIAAYIVKECERRNYFVNFSKLQKLMFCIYGAVLANYQQKLFDDIPYATEWGPIFPKLYKISTKEYLADGIIGYYNFRSENIKSTLDRPILKFIEEVIIHYGSKSIYELCSCVFQQDSPWFNAPLGGKIADTTIPDYMISQYFQNIFKKEK
ncbi:MAG: DUF4065 domain-containing protein [Succinivibrio sp.]|jgi:uncharacterized phage-associated protein|nr:DUF4065 domain-containing protein [Succinivibrio sp.]